MARTLGAYSTTHQAPSLQQVWQAMRIMRARFTTADLVATSSASDSAVDKYCRALGRTGFLRLMQPVVSGRPGSRNVWALVRDSGPTAPIRREDGSGVFDPNTGIVWPANLAKLPAARDLADIYQACSQGEAHG